MRSKMKFSLRILMSFFMCFFLVMIVVGLILSSSYLKSYKESVHFMIENQMTNSLIITEVIRDHEIVKSYVQSMILDQLQDSKKEYKTKADRSISEINLKIDQLLKSEDKEGANSLKEVRHALNEYSDLVYKIYLKITGESGFRNQIDKSGQENDQTVVLLSRASENFEEAIEQYKIQKQKIINATVVLSDNSVTYLNTVIFCFGIFLFVFGGMMYFIMYRFIYREVGGEPWKIREITNRMTEGDLDIDFSENTKGVYNSVENLNITMREVAANAETVANGNFMVQPTLRSEKDQLGNSLLKMTRSLIDLQKVTQEISNGKFNLRLNVKGENDLVSKSINLMSENLQANKIYSDEQNWLKDGLNRLSTELSGDQSIERLTGCAISFIGRYIDAGRGVIYMNDEVRKTLQLTSSYAFTERDSLSNFYEHGVGVVGQVALERKPILLRAVPKDEALITTGTLSSLPLCTYTYPVVYETELLGVIELSSLQPLTPVQIDFLNQSNQIVASGIYTAIQKSKIGDLLSKAQEAQKEAEEKTRMVQEANAQLEEQQQQIQQQSEELQQTNSQLEEQQQQLQQQSEELQQTNQQLEEQQQQLLQQTEELRRGNDQLLLAKEELDLKAKDLEMSNKYKSDFLANMSHELRTPLNSIILLSKMMQKNERGNLDKEDIKRSKVIHSAGEELLHLINDILDISKIEAGKTVLSISDFSTEDLINDQLHFFSSMAKNKGVGLSANDLLKINISSDKDKVSQVLRNFISNALKFTKKGNIEILVTESGNPEKPVKICVKDTGIGIAPEKHKLIFDAFQQVDSSISREFGGTGLGLTICQKIASLLHGEITLASELGKGSEFSLLLPHTLQPHIGEKQEYETAQSYSITSKTEPVEIIDDRKKIRTGDKVILIVEDDLSFSEIVAKVINKMHMKVLRAITAMDGLQLAQEYKLNGIILDLVLPDMNGVDFMRRLKSYKELRQVPVQIISGYEKNPELMRMGAFDFLQKPVDQDQIQKAIQGILNFSEKSPKDLLIVEDNEIHRQAMADLIKSQDIRIKEVETETQAINELKRGIYDAVIIDLALKSGEGMNICRFAREMQMKVPIIVYTGKELSPDEEKNLKKLADRIIIKTVHSENRLIDELMLFLHQTQKEISNKPASTDAAVKVKRLLGRSVMVVDDDIKNVFVMSTALEEHGASVIDAQNGKQALELLEQSDIDLVLMDIMMPVMDGYTAIKKIRENARTKNLPVIALTAKALKEDREKCIAAGANDYLAKPVDYDMLIGLVEAWCQKKI